MVIIIGRLNTGYHIKSFESMLDYIFFKLHMFFYKAQGQRDGAVIAMITLSCFLGLNIFTIISFLEGFKILPISNLNKNYLFVLALIMFTLCSIIFLRRRRYIQIESRFKNEQESKKIGGLILVILYFVLSIILFSIASMLRYDLIHSN